MTNNYYWRDVVTCWERNAVNQLNETWVTYSPSVVADFLQFYAQYKSQITYSRALNYYFEWITIEITEMARAIGEYRGIKSRKHNVLKNNSNIHN
jgi:hypothetical protein